jgi:signal transduction histidine kinase
MFGTLIFLGLRSIDEATALVREERLNAAYATAGFLERDFLHAARDAKAEDTGLALADPQERGDAADRLLRHLSSVDSFPFFRVTGIWALAPDGLLLAQAGTPTITPGDTAISTVLERAMQSSDEVVIVPAPGTADGDVPFVTIVTRLASSTTSTPMIIAIHTVSVNRVVLYDPTSWWQNGGTGADSGLTTENSRATYHLEVVSPEGRVVLGIGQDERPGTISPHVSAIENLMLGTHAGTLIHHAAPGEDFEPHLIAVVPLNSSGFHVVMEQPVDVALALPNRLRRQLMLATTIGFIITLLVAWVTTKRVVKPTEQLTAAAQRMADGDLDHPIDIRAQDEIGTLAQSLETMRQELVAASREIERTNQELESQVRERTARLGEVLGKVISAQEEERARLARELHDETAQTLGALSISLDRLRDALLNDPLHAMEHVTEAKSISNHLLEDTRRLILDLRPMALDDLGLAPAIRWYAETHLEERGVATTVEISQPSGRLTKYLEVSLFRIIQEAINNVAKHAGARHVAIRLAFQNSIAHVVVADDGRGFDVERVLSPGTPVERVGLLGMQERVRLLNGLLRIRSQPGEGTELSIEIPIVTESA